MYVLKFWLEMSLVVNIHFVLCPIEYFYHTFSKEKNWGKVPCKIHSYKWYADLFCWIQIHFFFLQGFVWIECWPHIDFPISPWELEAFCMVTLSRSIWKWESVGNSYGCKSNKNEKWKECNLVFKLTSLFTTLMMRASNLFMCLLSTRHYCSIKYN